MKKWLIGGSVALLLVFTGIAGIIWGKSQSGKDKKAEIKTDESDSWKWALYTSEMGKYNLQVPLKWETKEMTEDTDFITRTVITKVGEEKVYGSTQEIDITAAKPGKNLTVLATAGEFNDWFSKVATGEAKNKIKKLDISEIDGEKAVILTNTEEVEGIKDNEWYNLVWARHNNINYYLNFKGKGQFKDEDVILIRFMLSTFKFLE